VSSLPKLYCKEAIKGNCPYDATLPCAIKAVTIDLVDGFSREEASSAFSLNSKSFLFTSTVA